MSQLFPTVCCDIVNPAITCNIRAVQKWWLGHWVIILMLLTGLSYLHHYLGWVCIFFINTFNIYKARVLHILEATTTKVWAYTQVYLAQVSPGLNVSQREEKEKTTGEEGTGRRKREREKRKELGHMCSVRLYCPFCWLRSCMILGLVWFSP